MELQRHRCMETKAHARTHAHTRTHTHTDMAGSDLLAEPVVARVKGLELLANELVQDAPVDQRLPQLPDLTPVIPGVAQHTLQGLDERQREPQRERERQRWKQRERETYRQEERNRKRQTQRQ